MLSSRPDFRFGHASSPCLARDERGGVHNGQGHIVSKARAARNTRASAWLGPTICRPTGRAVLSEVRRGALRHQGVLRATIMEANGKAWLGFKQRRASFIESAVPVLAARYGKGETQALQRRIRIAFQFAIGSIINAVLNNPGPLRLSNSEFDEELTRAFCAYLRA
ncbi:hypothetical protein AWV79_33105 [Cupriavidus sp. UYMMa02A]|nr:hypothetical protein AWV79_33105 [Cupriavidus sp. UYMMa02A]